MDFQENGPTTPDLPPQQPVMPQPALAPRPMAPPPQRSGAGWKVLFGILFVLSLLANMVLVLIVFVIIAMFSTVSGPMLDEVVVRASSSSKKIALVSVVGMIASEQAEFVHHQLEAAKKDKAVKGVILRVNSPGGTIAASDRIYNDILTFRKDSSKPIIAFMEGLAASGGYYTSVACKTIVAEPTTITGSIGVISWYFAMQELLEDKLGVVPVVITGGEKKDWPSSFRAPTPEQIQYLEDRLVSPAYERFIRIVIDGRKGVLDEDDVRRLADGSIYTAELALQEKLIDQIGYLDDAVDLVKSMAGIGDARVVEYRRPFSMAALLRAQEQASFKVDKALIHDLARPELMYLWSAF